LVLSEGLEWSLIKDVKVRKAKQTDASAVNQLLSEWFDWQPESGRLDSIKRAIRTGGLLVANPTVKFVGFIHFVLHEDIIDGGPNSFISAFYVSSRHRGRGVGSQLLRRVIENSLARGAVGVETSTIHRRAKRFYQKNQFKQTFGDIGEVFLELDVTEYLNSHQGKPLGGRVLST